MVFDLPGAVVRVERSGMKANRIDIKIIGGNINNWPIFSKKMMQFEYEAQYEGYNLSVDDWKDILGQLMFGLKPVEGKDRSKNREEGSSFLPSFRSLFSYFVRKQDAFNLPFKQSSEQRTWDYQIALTYLLGLDWTIPQEFQKIRAQLDRLIKMQQAVRKGELQELGIYRANAAELRTKIAVAEREIERLKTNINTFQILPEYEKFSQESTEIARRLEDLNQQNTLDRILIDNFHESIDREIEPAIDNLADLYREVGIVFPDTITRRFEDVRKFHESVISNRRDYLSSEIVAAKQRISDRTFTMDKLAKRQAELIGFFKSGGAIEQLTGLQSELNRKENEVLALSRNYQILEEADTKKTQLEIARRQQYLRLVQDYKEQETTLKKAVIAFEKISEALYEREGSLNIEATESGPEFSISMPSHKSGGISKMQIFCFDMMLMQLWTERGLGTGFLVHDSHLFDGVDERQIATALEVGATTAKKFGFQYIMTMNSDIVPYEIFRNRNFNVDQHILPVKLTDASDEGRLFGIQFGSEKTSSKK